MERHRARGRAGDPRHRLFRQRRATSAEVFPKSSRWCRAGRVRAVTAGGAGAPDHQRQPARAARAGGRLCAGWRGGGEVWFKVDGGGVGRSSASTVDVEPAAVARNLLRCAELCPTWVQTCLFRWDGRCRRRSRSTLPGDAGIRRGEETTRLLKGVLLYGVARPSCSRRPADLQQRWPRKLRRSPSARKRADGDVKSAPDDTMKTPWRSVRDALLCAWRGLPSSGFEEPGLVAFRYSATSTSSRLTLDVDLLDGPGGAKPVPGGDVATALVARTAALGHADLGPELGLVHARACGEFRVHQLFIGFLWCMEISQGLNPFGPSRLDADRILPMTLSCQRMQYRLVFSLHTKWKLLANSANK